MNASASVTGPGVLEHMSPAWQRQARRARTLSWLSLAYMAAEGVIAAARHRQRRIGARLGSAATMGEGAQNILCAYVAAAVLAGLLASTMLGVRWLDPVVAFGIAGLAVHEGREAWEGEQGE